MKEWQPPTDEGARSGGTWGSEPRGQIMANLPHRRPQRRSSLRKSHLTPSRRPTPAVTAGERRRSAPARPRRSATAAARRRRETPRGLPELALTATVEAAKLPFGVTAAVARRAVDIVGRGRR